MGVFTDPSGYNRIGLLESAVFTSPAKIQGRTWEFKEVEEFSLLPVRPVLSDKGCSQQARNNCSCRGARDINIQS